MGPPLRFRFFLCLFLLYNSSTMTQPFFSIIIPTYNRRVFLKKAIDSVLCQSFNDFEIIIVDDGSNDGTRDLILSYDDARIRCVYQDNHGVAYTRNVGLTQSSGSFIAFLDSDDWWHEDKLKTAAEYINRYPEINIFHTEEVWYRNGELLAQKSKHKKPTGYVYKNALPLCCISISTAVINKTVFDKIGIFDEALTACEDYDFWLRATNTYEVMLIPEFLTLKDGGRPDQLSSSVWGLDRFRIKALKKMLLSETLSPERYESTLEELKKKCRIFAKGCIKHGKAEEAEKYSELAEKYKGRV